MIKIYADIFLITIAIKMSKQKFIPYLIFLILGSLSIHSFADVQVYGPWPSTRHERSRQTIHQ